METKESIIQQSQIALDDDVFLKEIEQSDNIESETSSVNEVINEIKEEEKKQENTVPEPPKKKRGRPRKNKTIEEDVTQKEDRTTIESNENPYFLLAKITNNIIFNEIPKFIHLLTKGRISIKPTPPDSIDLIAAEMLKEQSVRMSATQLYLITVVTCYLGGLSVRK